MQQINKIKKQILSLKIEENKSKIKQIQEINRSRINYLVLMNLKKKQ